MARNAELAVPPIHDSFDEVFPDDRLKLIFTCCHPSLTSDAQVALTLHTVCGIRTEEISRAFLDFHLLPAARADLLRRLGRMPEAARAYR